MKMARLRMSVAGVCATSTSLESDSAISANANTTMMRSHSSTIQRGAVFILKALNHLNSNILSRSSFMEKKSWFLIQS